MRKPRKPKKPKDYMIVDSNVFYQFDEYKVGDLSEYLSRFSKDLTIRCQYSHNEHRFIYDLICTNPIDMQKEYEKQMKKYEEDLKKYNKFKMNKLKKEMKKLEQETK